VLYERGWRRAVEVAGQSLRASLLTRRSVSVTAEDDGDDKLDGDGGGYVVNLDPRVIELLHEAKHLQLMNVDVPDTALALCQQQARITDIRDACVCTYTVTHLILSVFRACATEASQHESDV